MDGGGNVAGHLVDEHQAADFRNRFFGALLIIEKGCETVHERCLLLLHNGGEFRESFRGILPRLKTFSRHSICCMRKSTGMRVLFSAFTGKPADSQR